MSETKLPKSVDGLLTRLIELVKEDEQLHDAVVGAVTSYAHHQEAMADHKHSLASLALVKARKVEAKNGNRA